MNNLDQHSNPQLKDLSEEILGARYLISPEGEKPEDYDVFEMTLEQWGPAAKVHFEAFANTVLELDHSNRDYLLDQAQYAWYYACYLLQEVQKKDTASAYYEVQDTKAKHPELARDVLNRELKKLKDCITRVNQISVATRSNDPCLTLLTQSSMQLRDLIKTAGPLRVPIRETHLRRWVNYIGDRIFSNCPDGKLFRLRPYQDD